MAVTPSREGAHEFSAIVTNTIDPTNSFIISIHVFVTVSSVCLGFTQMARLSQTDKIRQAKRRSQAFRVHGDLDFGECTEGSVYTRETMLYNLSDAPLDLDLVSGVPSHVTFHVDRGVKPNEESSTVKSGEDGSQSRCRQLLLAPGQHRKVVMHYCAQLPPHMDTSILDDGRLVPADFQISLNAVDVSGSNIERRTLRCRALVCRSLVTVDRTEIDAGEVRLGTTVSKRFTVTNISELPTRIRLDYTSRIVTVSPVECEIPPRDSQVFTLSWCPTRIEKSYQKAISIVNLSNRNNDQSVKIHSHNVAADVELMKRSLYYVSFGTMSKSSSGADQINFGDMVASSSTLRTFTIKSATEGTLTLRLTASKESLRFYLPMQDSAANTQGSANAQPVNQSQQALDEADKRRALAAAVGEQLEIFQPAQNWDVFAICNTLALAWLDLDPGRRTTDSLHPTHGRQEVSKPRQTLKSLNLKELTENNKRAAQHMQSPNASDNSESDSDEDPETIVSPKTFFRQRKSRSDERKRSVSSTSLGIERPRTPSFRDPTSPDDKTRKQHLFTLDELAAGFSGHLPVTSQTVQEKQAASVRLSEQLQHDLATTLRTGRLVPIDTISIPAHQSVTVFVVCSPTDTRASGRLEKFTANISLKVDSCDRQAAGTADLSQKITILPVLGRVCTSRLLIAQRNIQVGFVRRNEARSRYIILENKSEMSLHYAIRKSGSIASACLHFTTGLYGLIPPYKTREVHFVLKPTMSGQYSEIVTFENVLNRSDSQEVRLKATIRNLPTFSVDASSLEYGKITPGQSMFSRVIELSNMSFGSRRFELLSRNLTSAFGNYVVNVLFESLGPQHVILSKETAEQIEKQLQKLKIATRKNQVEKQKKIAKKLAKLRAGNDSGDSSPNTSASEDDAQVAAQWNHCVISLQGRRSQAIRISLYVQPSGTDAPSERISGQFRIEIREKGKTDAVKYLSADATVLPSSSSDHLSSPDIRTTSGSSTENCSPAAATPEILGRLHDSWLQPSSASFPRQATISLDPPSVDFGTRDPGTELKGEVQISNLSDSAVVFALMDKKRVDDGQVPSQRGAQCLQFELLNGPLKPHETKAIPFKLSLLHVGLGRHHFQVDARNISQTETGAGARFNVFVNIRTSKFLLFPDHASQPSAVVECGNCYIRADTEFAKIAPVRVKNVSLSTIFVSSSSNLEKQLYVYSDKDTKTKFRNVRMLPGEVQVMHVCLKPQPSEEMVKSGHCRQVVGGIRLRVTDQVEEKDIPQPTLAQYTLRVTAFVGRALMRVTKKLSKLRVTASSLEPLGTISIQNLSQGLPLHVTVTPSQNLLIDQPPHEILPKAIQELRVRYRAWDAPGLHRNSILFYDNDSGKTEEVQVLAFKDNGQLQITTSQNSVVRPNAALVDTMVNFGVVCLAPRQEVYLSDYSAIPSSHAWDIVEEGRPEDQNFLMSNLTDDALRIQPLSDVQTRVVVQTADGKETDDFDVPETITRTSSGRPSKKWSTHVCGSPFEISGRQKVVARIACPYPTLISRRKWDSLRQGKPIEYAGTLFLSRSRTGSHSIHNCSEIQGRCEDIIQVIELRVQCVLSVGHTNVETLDLGEIGYSTSWKPTTGTFTVVNLSETYLKFRFNHIPSFVQSLTVISAGVMVMSLDLRTCKNHSGEVLIEPNAQAEISYIAELDAETAVPGDINESFVIENVRNPFNVMTVAVTGQCTVLGLEIDPQPVGDVIIVSPLLYPVSTTADCVFSVHKSFAGFTNYEVC